MAPEDFLQNTMKYYCLPKSNTADTKHILIINLDYTRL